MYKVLLFLIAFSALGDARGQKFPNLAPTPPMGWNSWNKFQCDGVNEKVIRHAADALVSTGMKAAGYEYINIDDCWQVGRDSAGNIIADPVKFPSGIKALADYVHSKGLKFGIYSDAGRKTCGGREGSRGHEYQDAITYAKWGVDYLKFDWCNADGQNTKESYTLMRDALFSAGRPIVFSICEWGSTRPWEWAGEVGQLWRTSRDIFNKWDNGEADDGILWGGAVLTNFDIQRGLEKYAGPNRWNDPDMLEVGNGKLTAAEDRAHFSLWCMIAAPLMAGNDLDAMSTATTAVLTNKELISIDQDSLGRQGSRIFNEDDFEIYAKPLAGGDTAICLFNRGSETTSLNIDWKKYRIGPGHPIRDCWKKVSAGNSASPYRAVIPKHDVIVLRLGKVT